MGRPNEYNVDAVRLRRVAPRAARCGLTARAQVPKFIMANGKMVQMLIHTDVARAPRLLRCRGARGAHAAFACPSRAQVKYLEFKAVDGSFVVRDKRVHKVPANDMEALRSPLMGIFEKRRARGFFIYVQDYNEQDQRTWQARRPTMRRRPRRETTFPRFHIIISDASSFQKQKGFDLRRTPMRAIFEYFGLDEGTTDFIGHALALQQSEAYLDQARPRSSYA